MPEKYEPTEAVEVTRARPARRLSRAEDKSANNALYYGDNLENLRKYIRDESVDLCYIDPPFNSKRTYNQIYNNIGEEDRAHSPSFY